MATTRPVVRHTAPPPAPRPTPPPGRRPTRRRARLTALRRVLLRSVRLQVHVDLQRLLDVVDLAHRLLERPHAPAELAPDVAQATRPEDDQAAHQADDQVGRLKESFEHDAY